VYKLIKWLICLVLALITMVVMMVFAVLFVEGMCFVLDEYIHIFTGAVVLTIALCITMLYYKKLGT